MRQDGLPATSLARADLDGKVLTQFFTEVGLAGSGKQVKDALGRNAVLINGREVGFDQNADPQSAFAADAAFYDRFYLVRLGKKKYHLFEIA